MVWGYGGYVSLGLICLLNREKTHFTVDGQAEKDTIHYLMRLLISVQQQHKPQLFSEIYRFEEWLTLLLTFQGQSSSKFMVHLNIYITSCYCSTAFVSVSKLSSFDTPCNILNLAIRTTLKLTFQVHRSTTRKQGTIYFQNFV